MITLARPPKDKEKQEALVVLDRLEQSAGNGDHQLLATLGKRTAGLASLPDNKAAALLKLCLAVYNLNEYAFVD